MLLQKDVVNLHLLVESAIALIAVAILISIILSIILFILQSNIVSALQKYKFSPEQASKFSDIYNSLTFLAAFSL